ncbi:MAG TPA: BatD family protein [Myxococcota bacterium]|nr:BatD family protein [Myxococcota bacterium]
MSKRRPLFEGTVVLLGLLLLAASVARAADLTAQLERTRIEPGESVRLLIRENGSSGAEPDLAPLSQDFDVLDVSQQSRMQFLNGDLTRSHDWIVTLAPRGTGRLQIPSLRVGDQETAPLELEVAAASAPSGPPGAEPAAPAAPVVFVEAEVDDPNPFVQGRTVLSVRVHARQGIVEAALSDPEIPGALVERIGEDARESRTQGGQTYDVIVRRYSVVPQQSGRIEIAPLTLDAMVREAAPRRRQGFGGFHDFFSNPFGGGHGRSLIDEFFGARSRRVRAHTEAIALDVKPVPAGIALSQWLPARALELRENWSPDPAGVRVGDQITRTVGVRAAGVAAAQLPDLTGPPIEGLKQYPEPADSANREIGGDLWSVKQQESVLVPTQPGPLVVPAIEVPWYDVAANEMKVASLPARTLEVLPAVGGAAPDAPAPAPSAVPEPDAQAAQSPFLDRFGDLRSLFGAALAFGSAIGFTLVAWRRRRRSAGNERSGARPAGEKPRAAAAAFERACRENDAHAAARALVAWGRACWPASPPNTPGDVARRLGGEALAAEVDALNAVRYSAEVATWRGEALLLAWRAARGGKVVKGARAQSPLPSLYPARGEGDARPA